MKSQETWIKENTDETSSHQVNHVVVGKTMILLLLFVNLRIQALLGLERGNMTERSCQ